MDQLVNEAIRLITRKYHHRDIVINVPDFVEIKTEDVMISTYNEYIILYLLKSVKSTLSLVPCNGIVIVEV